MNMIVDGLKSAGNLITSPFRAAYHGLGVTKNIVEVAWNALPPVMLLNHMTTGSATKGITDNLGELGGHIGHGVAANAQMLSLAAAPFTGGWSMAPGFAVAYAETKMSEQPTKPSSPEPSTITGEPPKQCDGGVNVKLL